MAVYILFIIGIHTIYVIQNIVLKTVAIIHVININTVAKTICIDTPNISIFPIPIMLNITIKLSAIDSSTLTDILLFILVIKFIPKENI